MPIIWTENAINTYIESIDFIMQQWSLKEVSIFENDVKKLIIKLETFNNLCPKSSILNLRKCVISKHNALIYTLQNETVVFIAFIHNKALNKKYI